jgi:hypothetical protein
MYLITFREQYFYQLGSFQSLRWEWNSLSVGPFSNVAGIVPSLVKKGRIIILTEVYETFPSAGEIPNVQLPHLIPFKNVDII